MIGPSRARGRPRSPSRAHRRRCLWSVRAAGPRRPAGPSLATPTPTNPSGDQRSLAAGWPGGREAGRDGRSDRPSEYERLPHGRRARLQLPDRRIRDEMERHGAVTRRAGLLARRRDRGLRREHGMRRSRATRSSGTRRCPHGPRACSAGEFREAVTSYIRDGRHALPRPGLRLGRRQRGDRRQRQRAAGHGLPPEAG